jgi:hypothetical protein
MAPKTIIPRRKADLLTWLEEQQRSRGAYRNRHSSAAKAQRGKLMTVYGRSTIAHCIPMNLANFYGVDATKKCVTPQTMRVSYNPLLRTLDKLITSGRFLWMRRN